MLTSIAFSTTTALWAAAKRPWEEKTSILRTVPAATTAADYKSANFDIKFDDFADAVTGEASMSRGMRRHVFDLHAVIAGSVEDAQS